mmetsp:Transcript_27440/g.80084  ORF Transcript_27440/g.80084 Transcript_27440/m.80084 type:complete len:268 (-) Transcript_27440:106-909(-)
MSGLPSFPCLPVSWTPSCPPASLATSSSRAPASSTTPSWEETLPTQRTARCTIWTICWLPWFTSRSPALRRWSSSTAATTACMLKGMDAGGCPVPVAVQEAPLAPPAPSTWNRKASPQIAGCWRSMPPTRRCSPESRDTITCFWRGPHSGAMVTSSQTDPSTDLQTSAREPGRAPSSPPTRYMAGPAVKQAWLWRGSQGALWQTRVQETPSSDAHTSFKLALPLNPPITYRTPRWCTMACMARGPKPESAVSMVHSSPSVDAQTSDR